MRDLILLSLLIAGCGEAPPPAPEDKPLPAPVAEAPQPVVTNAEEAVVDAPPPSAKKQRPVCLSVFTEDAANKAFQVIGLSAPEGCKFEGVSTKHSKMRIRWELPPYQDSKQDRKIVDFLVVPTVCAEAYDVAPGGSTLSAAVIDDADKSCPKQWAQLVQLVQSDALPETKQIRAE